MKNWFTLSITLALSFINATPLLSQGDALPPNAEAGKCYAKCLVNPTSRIKEEKLPVYIGNNPKVKTKEVKVAISLKKSEWVKKLIDNNEVWCLEDEGEDIFEIVSVAKKPHKVPQKDISYESLKILIKEATYTEWQEVLCGHQVTPELIKKVKAKLALYGYNLSSDPKDNFGPNSKNALIHFQRKHNLPLGAFDFETMAYLGFKF